MNNNILEKLGVNVSKSWIVGCSILSCGIMTHAYLNGISNIPLAHMKYKYRLEIQQIEKKIDLSDKIKNEEKIISYYWRYYNIIFMMGITGLSFVVLRFKK